MEGTSAEKCDELETLVIQNISNVNELKAILNDIIAVGKDYKYDVSSCMKTLLKSSDHSIVLLAIQAISELAKCDLKRESYAELDIVKPILDLMDTDLSPNKIDMLKQCCRSLGNLCCDCNSSRNVIQQSKGHTILCKLLKATVKDTSGSYDELKILLEKMLLNYGLGGPKYIENLVDEGIINLQLEITKAELQKNDMDDDMITAALSILSAISDIVPDIPFDVDTNKALLKILKETANMDVSELCLDILHTQAEHESVKSLIAKENGIQLVCLRLEHLLLRHEEGEIRATQAEIENVVKQACDLIIIVLTGDEAMHTLYKNGTGEVYQTMVRWLEADNYSLMITAILAIGNFARQDQYCIQMMEKKIFERLLNIFELYHGVAVRSKENQCSVYPVEETTLNKIQHAALSAIRNLTVAVENKKAAASKGKAAPILINALPHIDDHHVAYKLLAAIRMLVDGQDGVAVELSQSPAALEAIARWGQAAEHAGAAGEAPRLLAWTVRQARRRTWLPILQVQGCIASLVNMLVASHAVMQNEAILALTLIGTESFAHKPDKDFNAEKSFVYQVIKSEIGKHLSVLIETNCAKMPVEVAENLMAFVDITVRNGEIIEEYKQAKVHESLHKIAESRKDFSDILKRCIEAVVTVITSQ